MFVGERPRGSWRPADILAQACCAAKKTRGIKYHPSLSESDRLGLVLDTFGICLWGARPRLFIRASYRRARLMFVGERPRGSWRPADILAQACCAAKKTRGIKYHPSLSESDRLGLVLDTFGICLWGARPRLDAVRA